MRGTRSLGASAARAVASIAALGLAVVALPGTTTAAATFDGENADRWECLGYNGLTAYNTTEAVSGGMFKTARLPAYRVARGGDVDWRLDPYRDPSWRMWLHSLNWIGDLVERAQRDGDTGARSLALGIARDFVRDNPVHRPQVPEAALESTARRTNVLTCLYRVAPEPWLRDAMLQHADWLVAHWSGAWNKGLDEDLAVLGVACVTGTDALIPLSLDRLARNARDAFDDDGVSNEQSPAYTQYAVARWRKGIDRLSRCGLSAPPGITGSLDRAETFLAHATRPNGRLAPIGDTEDRLIGEAPGTGYEYTGSRGRAGAPPAATTAVYPGGWAFGRSTWRPFGGATWYALRFGPRPLNHGHDDHGQVLFSAYGRDVLVEGGYDGYRPGAYRRYLEGRYAHNVFTVAGRTFLARRGTDLVAAGSDDRADTYTLYDVRYRGVAHQRSVLVSKQAPFVAVLDTARAAVGAGISYSQWWHLPHTARARVAGSSVVATDGGQRILVVPLSLPGSRTASQPIRTAVVRGQTTPSIAGWVSPGLYQRRPAPTVSVTTAGRGAQLLTVVLPLPHGMAGGVGRVRKVANHWVVQVNVGGRGYPVWVSGTGRLSLQRPID